MKIKSDKKPIEYRFMTRVFPTYEILDLETYFRIQEYQLSLVELLNDEIMVSKGTYAEQAKNRKKRTMILDEIKKVKRWLFINELNAYSNETFGY